MNSSVLFPVPVEETIEESADCVQVTLFWNCCNRSYKVIGKGDDEDSALEMATRQFNDVMNFILKLL